MDSADLRYSATPAVGYGSRRAGTLVFLFCAFPYVTFMATPFDTQPYAIISAVMVLFLLLIAQRGLLVPKPLLPFLLVLLYATAALLLSADLMVGIRSWIGYLSVFAISLVAYHTFRNVRPGLFLFVVGAWLVVGVAQLVIDRHFGSILLSRLATSNTRGITSLAVEPSLYAVVCIYLLILNDVFYSLRSYSRKTYLSVFVMVVLQVFLARAGVGVILFFVYLTVKSLFQAGIGKVVKGAAVMASFLAVFLLSFQLVPSLQATRVGVQLNLFLEGPSRLLMSDASAADRLGHVLVSHSSLFQGHVLGLGLGNWGTYANDVALESGDIVSELSAVSLTIHSERIMSGWGTAIFELGVIGLVFLVAYVRLMYRGWKGATNDMKRTFISSAVTIYFVMLMAVPIAFPLFGYLLGVFAYLQRDGEKTTPAVAEPSTSRVENIYAKREIQPSHGSAWVR